jgi:hypothetical protein
MSNSSLCRENDCPQDKDMANWAQRHAGRLACLNFDVGVNGFFQKLFNVLQGSGG